MDEGKPKMIVGIDFGTSTTVVRWRLETSDEFHVVTDANAEGTIASLIFIPNEGKNWIFGNQASKYSSEGRLVANFKMDLLSEDTQTRRQAIEYITKFMGYLYERFCIDIRGESYGLMDIYVSYPAKWTSDMCQLMKQMVANAGFGNHGQILGKTEPQAAAAALIKEFSNDILVKKALISRKPINIMMLDMGAGTSDIILFQLHVNERGRLEINKDKVRRYPTDYHSQNCGGREIDEILRANVLEYLQKGKSSDKILEKWFSTQDAKSWKEQIVSLNLERGEIVKAPPSSVDTLISYCELDNAWNKVAAGDYSMSRHKFEYITEKHWADLYKLISSSFVHFKKECGIGAEDIDFLFLTGGHSQWYCIENLFNGQGINGAVAVDGGLNFAKIVREPKRIIRGKHPQASVAEGLCLPDLVDIPASADRNIWMKIDIDDKQSTEYVKIVKQRELLPLETKFELVIKMDRIISVDSRKHLIKLKCVEGTTIEEGKHYSFVTKQNSMSYLKNLWKIICDSYSSVQVTFKIRMHIKMLDDNTLLYNGDVYINDEYKSSFTHNDFTLI